MTGLGEAAGLWAALDAGVLDALVQGPQHPPVLALRLGLDPRALGLVLDLLVASGLARTTPAGVSASEDLSQELRRTPGGGGALLDLWRGLPAWLRDGATSEAWRHRDATYPQVVQALGELWADAPVQLAQAVGQGRAVLDLGCGSGTWGRALRAAGGTLTGLDRAPVLARFLAEDDGGGPTVAEAGDMHAAPLPPGCDRVVLANVLRIEPAPRARALLHRATAALGPGGLLVVVDALAGGTPEAERQRAVYALHLARRMPEGRVHPPEEVAAWMTEAGLVDLAPVALEAPMGALGALVGRAP